MNETELWRAARMLIARAVLPRAIRIEASSHCQLKCPSCPTADGSTLPAIARGVLRPEAFRELLDANSWVREVELSNYGEMFLNPWLADILRIAHEHNVAVSAANGVNFNYAHPGAIEALVRYRMRFVTCSIDGASAETYRVYRKGGDFKRVLANIRALNVLKKEHNSPYPMLTWQFVVFGHNEHEIAQARAMARSLDMSFVLKLSWDDRVSPLRDAERVRAEMPTGVATRAEYQSKFHKDYADGICRQLWEAPQLNWDGTLLGCCRNFWGDFGLNAFQHGLRTALNSEKMRYARAMLQGKARPRQDIPCTTCDIYLNMKARNTWIRSPVSRAGLRGLFRLADRLSGSRLQKLRNALWPR